MMKSGKSHYVFIKNLSRLLSTKNSKHKGKMYYCLNCLNGFNTLKARDEHFSYCCNHEAIKVNMPTEKDKFISYKNASKEVKKALSIACDLESVIDKNGKHISHADIQLFQDVLMVMYLILRKVYLGKDCVTKLY